MFSWVAASVIGLGFTELLELRTYSPETSSVGDRKSHVLFLNSNNLGIENVSVGDFKIDGDYRCFGVDHSGWARAC